MFLSISGTIRLVANTPYHTLTEIAVENGSVLTGVDLPFPTL
jgi:hypothetical protein